ncbi:hypothetical protein JAAARDRAFT_400966 [Jaapia argillacea MUCL 33604]|uniref:Uncharacterized protein n=1 Tax=Jaapia argillacea MUCL 33604 TaxID=933084 RepID=A0A067PWC9_9AGAM|nr:hypothetical protein JAAARDRAFT_400966 [Jaapia argillacea MUCL 33604]
MTSLALLVLSHTTLPPLRILAASEVSESEHLAQTSLLHLDCCNTPVRALPYGLCTLCSSTTFFTALALTLLTYHELQMVLWVSRLHVPYICLSIIPRLALRLTLPPSTPLHPEKLSQSCFKTPIDPAHL